MDLHKGITKYKWKQNGQILRFFYVISSKDDSLNKNNNILRGF